MSTIPTWATGSATYTAYLAASQRCADAMSGIRIEPETGRRGQIIGYWLTINGKTIESNSKRGTFSSEITAREAAKAHLNPKPAEQPAAKPAPMKPGWSNASKARRGQSPDGGVGALLGMASHVPAGSYECHYCGLDRRHCDCH